MGIDCTTELGQYMLKKVDEQQVHRESNSLYQLYQGECLRQPIMYIENIVFQ